MHWNERPRIPSIRAPDQIAFDDNGIGVMAKMAARKTIKSFFQRIRFAPSSDSMEIRIEKPRRMNLMNRNATIYNRSQQP